MMTAGVLSVVFGVIGILVPILPTTPFLLLAAYLFAKSSDRLYNMLINNRLLGSYIRNYREKRGVKLWVKTGIISLLWVTILYSAFFATELLWLRILLICIASAVTYHIYSINTLRE